MLALVIILLILTLMVALLTRTVTVANGHLATQLFEIVQRVVSEAIRMQDDRLEKRIRRHPGTEPGQVNFDAAEAATRTDPGSIQRRLPESGENVRF